MAKNPSSIFYWVDWTSDLALRKCSAAAQGMWMQMLAIAAEAGGYVKVGDDPCSICDLAEITGWDKRSVSKWVRELERKGVFSRDENGTIFCRRMRREAEARAVKQANGGAKVRKKSARSRHPHEDIKQPDLLDNPPPKTEKFTDSDSRGSVATSSDSTTPIIKSLPESPNAARAIEPEKEAEGDKNGRVVSQQRCALSKPAIRRTPVGVSRPALMPARWSDRHRDGECDELPSQAPAADYRNLDRQDQGRPGAAEAKAKRKNQIKTLRWWSQHSPNLADDERGHRLEMLARATEANNSDAWHSRSDEDRRCYDALAAKARRLPLDDEVLTWIHMAEHPRPEGGLYRSANGWKYEIERLGQLYAANGMREAVPA